MCPGSKHYLSPFDGLLFCVAQFRLRRLLGSGKLSIRSKIAT